MRSLIAATRYLVLLGVVASIFSGAGAFVAGAWKAVNFLSHLPGDPAGAAADVALVHEMDTLLIGAGLLIFGFGLYSLFIGELAVPQALVANSLYDLKGKLAVIIVLVLAVSFLEHFVNWEDGHQALLHAIAAALVSTVLVALATWKR